MHSVSKSIEENTENKPLEQEELKVTISQPMNKLLEKKSKNLTDLSNQFDVI